MGDLGELHPWNFKYLLEILVVVDVLPLLRVLQPISLGGGGKKPSYILIHTHGYCVLTLMYCQTALMMSGRVAVCMPSSLASLLVSLYCIGCKDHQTYHIS